METRLVLEVKWALKARKASKKLNPMKAMKVETNTGGKNMIHGTETKKVDGMAMRTMKVVAEINGMTRIGTATQDGMTGNGEWMPARTYRCDDVASLKSIGTPCIAFCYFGCVV